MTDGSRHTPPRLSSPDLARSHPISGAVQAQGAVRGARRHGARRRRRRRHARHVAGLPRLYQGPTWCTPTPCSFLLLLGEIPQIPHMVHSHAVQLPPRALLIGCTIACGTGLHAAGARAAAGLLRGARAHVGGAAAQPRGQASRRPLPKVVQPERRAPPDLRPISARPPADLRPPDSRPPPTSQARSPPLTSSCGR